LKLLTLILFLLICSSTCLAQREYDVWYYGSGTGIDFRSAPTPSILTNGPFKLPASAEGWAVYGDPATGEPRIICDGDLVYDRNLKIMPNGTGLFGGGGTSAQAACIVPLPCSETKYLIINTDLFGYSRPSLGSHYSVVDLSLNGGLGDVVEKNIPINPLTDEHLAVVRYERGPDYWVILHSQGGNTFYAYRVTSNGISLTPVVSHCGQKLGTGESYGYLKGSPDGRKLAIASGEDNLVELFNFDAYTGVVSDPITILDATMHPVTKYNGENLWAYGVCFSPDNSKLYFSLALIDRIYQCDVSLGSPSEIRKSLQCVNDSINPEAGSKRNWGMELGPDGKIYVSTWCCWLSVIESPNVAGMGCLFKDRKYSYLKLGSSVHVYLGLPNNIEGRSKPLPDTLFTIRTLQDTITKEGIFVPILLSLREQYTDLTIYGHYDVSSVELLGVSSGGQQVTANISNANGTFTIELPAGMNLQGVQLDWLFDAKRNTSSTSFIIDSVEFAGSTISCQPFTQVITVQPQCGDSILQHFLSTGGLPQFTLTPNPADNIITVKSSKDGVAGSFVLYDQLGKKVLDENHRASTATPISLDVRALPPGIYYLRITADQFTTTRSVIINH
jgi:WD40 repeat protein